MEEEDDDDDLPSATSPNEVVEDEDDEAEPVRKKQKRQSGGDSATASSPARGADVDLEEAVSTSSGARSPGGWSEPLAAPPVSSAPPRAFARLASVSLGSDDEFKTTRLVSCWLRVVFCSSSLLVGHCTVLLQSSFWRCQLPPS